MTAEERKSIIIETAWVYFKSDQLGPKNYKKVEDVIKELEEGKALSPLVCWGDGKVSWGNQGVERFEVIGPKGITITNTELSENHKTDTPTKKRVYKKKTK